MKEDKLFTRKRVIILLVTLLISILVGFFAYDWLQIACMDWVVYEDGSFVLDGCLPWHECAKGINLCQMEADEWELMDVGEYLECRPIQEGN